MPQVVCMGAQMQCTFGAAPSNLMMTPENMTNANNMSTATIMDNIPMKNIMPFGVCSSLSNPQVAAATAAAQGVLTPQPCIPVTSAPWILTGPAKVMIKTKPALLNTGKLMCNWGGQISIVNAGQTKVNA